MNFKKIYKFDKDEMQRYIDEKLIVTQRHPTLPLTIYNYTKHCQYERLWDSYTISARGLVLDDDYNVIARGYDKFFNYGELDEDFDYTQFNRYEIIEKVDGQYIAVFYYGGEWIVMSRGSFTSPFALKATELLASHNMQYWSQRYVYIFELIWSEERIVVDYGGVDKLMLTGMTIASNDSHVELTNIHMIYSSSKDIAKRFPDLSTTSFEDLFDEDDKKSEGFVINFINDNVIVYKMKIKFADYVRLHSVMTKISARNIWGDLKVTGELSESFIAVIPDEMYDWVHEMKREIDTRTYEYYTESLIWWHNAREYAYAKYDDYGDEYKKAFALYNIEYTPKEYRGVVFSIDRTDLNEVDVKRHIMAKFAKPGPNIMFGDKINFNNR